MTKSGSVSAERGAVSWAELAILGAALTSGEVEVRNALLDLEPDDFADPGCRELASLILDALMAGSTPDPVLILGTHPHLEGLMNVAVGTPETTVNVGEWARSIRVDRCRREAIRRLEQAHRALMDKQKNPAKVLAVLEDQARLLATRAAGVDQPPTLAEVLDEAMNPDRLDPGARIPTGFNDLDALLSGGYEPGDMVVVAGRPGMGKTTFVVNLLRRAIDLGEPVVFSSLEMRPVQIGELLVQACANTPVTVRRMLEGTDERAIEQYERAVARIREHPLQLCTAHTPASLMAVVDRHKNQHNTRVVVVDYLQLMQGGRTRYQSRQEEVADISRHLKLMAMTQKCVVLALAQLSRGVEARSCKRPQLSDLRDSGQIEQDADSILMLYREEYYTNKEPGLADVIVAKNRSGKTGTVKLTYRADYRRFDDHVEDY